MTKREYKAWLILIIICIFYAMITSCADQYEIAQNEQRIFKECMELAADLATSDDHTDDIIDSCQNTARVQAHRMGAKPKGQEATAWE